MDPMDADDMDAAGTAATVNALEMQRGYRLRWLDFDRYGRLRPAAVLDLLQDMATLQAEVMGIGYEAMQAKGVFWALVRLKYQMTGTPCHHQAVQVRTWPHTPSRFSFQRDYQILAEDGDELVKATSEWVLMDIAERRFAKVGDVYEAQGAFLGDRAFPCKPKKIAWPGQENLPVYEVVPQFGCIDQNGHVNNSCYPGFVMDALDPGPERILDTLQIDFRHEVVQGMPLQVHLNDEGERTAAQGVRPDGETAFNCLIEWAADPEAR